MTQDNAGRDPLAERWARLAARWQDDPTLPPGLRALAADIAAVSPEAAIPAPDWNFLPPMPLSAYVRQVGEQVSRDYFPEVSGGVSGAADSFFQRLDRHPPRRLMEHRPVYGTHAPDPMTVVSVTYRATVQLQSLETGEGRADALRFAMAAYAIAVEEAERGGLSREDADRFAAGFAEVVRTTAGLFGQLTVDY